MVFKDCWRSGNTPPRDTTWAKLKQTWNIKMHKMWYIVESRYVKLCLLKICLKPRFKLSAFQLNLPLLSQISMVFLLFYHINTKYLLTVSDIFDMHKILVIILKAPSSLEYPQVSLNCIHIFYIYTLYIALQIDHMVHYTLSYKSTNWFLKNHNLFPIGYIILIPIQPVFALSS
jgi:hypothetical protein